MAIAWRAGDARAVVHDFVLSCVEAVTAPREEERLAPTTSPG
jgi:hypothetical protein